MSGANSKAPLPPPKPKKPSVALPPVQSPEVRQKNQQKYTWETKPAFEGKYVGEYLVPKKLESLVTIIGSYTPKNNTQFSLDIEEIRSAGATSASANNTTKVIKVHSGSSGGNLGGNKGGASGPNKAVARRDASASRSRGNVVARRLKITINDFFFQTRQDVLSTMNGSVRFTLDMKEIGIFGLIKPKYSGTGVVWTKSTNEHFLFVPVNGTAVIDKRWWYLSEGTLTTTNFQNTIGNTVFSGKGLVEIKVEGKGLVVLKVPFPPTELHKIPLNKGQVTVNGNISILRLGDVETNPTLLGDGCALTMTDSVVQAFEGTGEVWLCPTLPFYVPNCALNLF